MDLPIRGWLTIAELLLETRSWLRAPGTSAFTLLLIDYSSWTTLESACEDYGQAVVYRGTIPHHPHVFELDKHHRIETGKYFLICGNSWRMLHDTRLAAHFDFYGNFDRHYGIFPGCGMGLPFDDTIRDAAGNQIGRMLLAPWASGTKRSSPSVSSDPSRSENWRRTPDDQPRGFIQPHALDELWFHTGTACNLACPFCLEGSKPGDDRLQLLRFEEVVPFVDEALDLGVKQFSFTGGEPFINKDIVRILDYALLYQAVPGADQCN